MKRTCIAAFGLLILVIVILAVFLPPEQPKPSSLSEQAASFAPLLPETDVPGEIPSELAVPFAQAVPQGVYPVPATPHPWVVTSSRVVPVQGQPVPPPLPAPVAPVSYVYFYTGVPAQPAPTATTVYYYTGGGSTPVAVSAPMVQSYMVPVFVPQVVPSRVGAPKWVYSNGVVIKPKVYFPHQPVRNSFRVVTP